MNFQVGTVAVEVQRDQLPIRDELRGQNPYGAPQLEVPVQLNTNENPYSPSPTLIAELVKEVERCASSLNRYPDRDALKLREQLATYVSAQTGVGVSRDNVWAANGSNEILQQLLQAFGGPGRTALGCVPSYSMHPILCAGTQTKFVGLPRDENFHVDTERVVDAVEKQQPSVVFITSPNNPTGTVTPLEGIEHILHVAPGIVIVDEAYGEFSNSPSATTLIERYPSKLVVSRTMSKAFDFAGGRLGYFVAAPAFVEAVMLVRLPYHLSTLTQAAATVALRHADDTLATVRIIVEERERVAEALKSFGFELAQSESNFLFFGQFEDQSAVWKRFLDRGVLIRDVGVPGYLRATIGFPHENDAFLAVAAEIARENRGE